MSEQQFNQRITIRVSMEMLVEMEDALHKLGYRNYSDVARDGIQLLLDRLADENPGTINPLARIYTRMAFESDKQQKLSQPLTQLSATVHTYIAARDTKAAERLVEQMFEVAEDQPEGEGRELALKLLEPLTHLRPSRNGSMRPSEAV